MKVYLIYLEEYEESSVPFCKEYENREDALEFWGSIQNRGHTMVAIIEGVRLHVLCELAEMPAEMSRTKEA